MRISIVSSPINWNHASPNTQVNQKKQRAPIAKLIPTPEKRSTMSMDLKKSNKIREIVRLQQILKKWRKLANSSRITTTTTPTTTATSKSMKFLKRTLSLSECEGASTNVVPKGYLAVCVGEELKRFIIPTEYLGHEAFQILLSEAEEEFGFQQAGVLRFPCEVSVFESVLKMVDGKKDKFSSQECRLRIEEIMGYCAENQLAYSHHPQSPLCR